MHDYPRALPRIDQIEPVPRRVTATHQGVPVLDTVQARYVFEWAFYPQFYVPRADVTADLIATDEVEQTSRGRLVWHDLRVGDTVVRRACRVVAETDKPDLAGRVRFEWDALEHWYEEDEEVFVHPRNPYVRVDALRSSRPVRVELDGVVLADSAAPVLVFETGLPTRYYVDKSTVQWQHLRASATRTACPYKGRTTGYWDADSAAEIAWCYEFPTRQLLPIAGLVGFLNERLDLIVDGVALDRPRTHFS